MPENNEFKDLFERYNCLKKICENARDRASNPAANKYVQKISLPLFGKKSGYRKEEVNEYFEALHLKIDDLFFLDIVAHFEQIIFKKIDNASGKIKRIVKERYKKPDPFNVIATSFIKNEEDIYSLKNVHNLLKNHIPKSLSDDLAAIIEHRNYIAHASRIGKLSAFDVKDIVHILNEILDHI